MIASSLSAFHFTHLNRSYWMPFLISPEYLPKGLRGNYRYWLFIEIFGHFLTAISAVLFVLVAWKVKVMHINMNILNTYTINILSQFNMIARLILISVELSGVSNGIEGFLIAVCIVKTFLFVSIYNYVSYITFERYAALIFSSDYETNRRIWVPFSLILGNSLIAGPIAVLLVYDYLDGVVYVLLIFCVSNLSCVAFMFVKAETEREDIRLNSFNFRKKSYTVSQRWQVKDNVRLAMDTRFLVVGTASQISFYLPFFFIPPLFLGDKSEWRATLEVNKAIFQLLSAYGFALAELFVLFTFPRHTDYVKSLFGLSNTPISPSAIPTVSQTADDHFESLRELWN